MIALERIVTGLDVGGPTWMGLAAGGWLAAVLVALVALWQAARADETALRAAEAAHELRGPLCAARLALGALERTYPDAPRVARTIAAVDLELRRAGLALDGLAGLSAGGFRNGAPATPRERVDLGALAATAEPAWQALAHAAATTLDVRVPARPVMVSGDPRTLLQGIENLVANACRHGRGPVRVSIGADARHARVTVSDHGGGPSPKVVRRAQRRARRPWAGRGRASVHGHGMAIAVRAAREGGGRLQARANPARCLVWLELPLRESAPSRWRVLAGRRRRASRDRGGERAGVSRRACPARAR